MPIAKVDAHHHLWTRKDNHYPALSAPPVDRFFGNTGKLPREFGATDFATLAAQQNVLRSVHVEAHYMPAIDETAAIDAIADAGPFPHAIIANVDLAANDVDAEFEVHLRSSRLRGVRATVNWDADPLFCSARSGGVLSDADWRRGYARAGALGLSVEVMAMPMQLTELARVAARYSNTVLIVGHCGLPARRTTEEDRAWREGLAALAALSHVVVKISGLGMVDHHWTTQSIAPLVNFTIDTFGAERCMFGSNFPVDGLHASYQEIWEAFDEITSAMSTGDRAALFSDTAMRVYRLT